MVWYSQHYYEKHAQNSILRLDDVMELGAGVSLSINILCDASKSCDQIQLITE